MGFWLIAGALVLAVGALLVLALVRGRADDGPAAPEFDIQVYRDQLAEVDRDLARGVLGEEEAGRVRIEVSRRLLEADKAAKAARRAGQAPRQVTLAAMVLGGLFLGGSGAVYAWLGAPGYPDMPLKMRLAEVDAARAARPTQAEREAAMGLGQFTPPPAADAEFLELMVRLRAAVADNPDDLHGQRLLSRNEAMLGNFPAAHRAQARVIALRAGRATADDYVNLADLMILAVEGYVSPEAEAALRAGLQISPRHGPARYYMGHLYAQTGRPDLAFSIWQPLLGESRPDAPWMPLIVRRIEQVARDAGIQYSLPSSLSAPPRAPAPGPDAADIEAAGEMSPEERQEMIRNMVDGLAERLATEGGGPEDWARLISALGVLGQTERAAAIWGEAQQVFAPEPGAIEIIREAAQSAGVAQ